MGSVRNSLQNRGSGILIPIEASEPTHAHLCSRLIDMVLQRNLHEHDVELLFDKKSYLGPNSR